MYQAGVGALFTVRPPRGAGRESCPTDSWAPSGARPDEIVLRDGVALVCRPGWLPRHPDGEVGDADVAERLRAMSATANPDTRLQLRSIDIYGSGEPASDGRRGGASKKRRGVRVGRAAPLSPRVRLRRARSSPQHSPTEIGPEPRCAGSSTPGPLCTSCDLSNRYDRRRLASSRQMCGLAADCPLAGVEPIASGCP